MQHFLDQHVNDPVFVLIEISLDFLDLVLSFPFQLTLELLILLPSSHFQLQPTHLPTRARTVVLMMATTVDFRCANVEAWKEALSSYQSRLQSLNKPELMSLDDFYRTQLPLTLHGRDPTPYITKPELSRLMKWKLSRGKWRPRLLGFVDSLGEEEVEVASRNGFGLLPDLEKAVAALTILKGVGPATASAILAAYAPDVAPFMSDEVMLAVLGNKDYTLKQYLILAEKLQDKARELSLGGFRFTASEVERALWSSYVAAKSSSSLKEQGLTAYSVRNKKRKR